jgi:hypothetical protein
LADEGLAAAELLAGGVLELLSEGRGAADGDLEGVEVVGYCGRFGDQEVDWRDGEEEGYLVFLGS